MGRRAGSRTSGQEAWQQFLSAIGAGCEEIGCPLGGEQEAWFRGQTNAERYRLLPGLFRGVEAPDSEPGWTHVRQVESDLFYEFSTRARELHESNMSDWDILFAMQHYGTPTRLLDWTETLGVAVYFATCRLPVEPGDLAPPCVWILNPYRLNGISWVGEDLVHPPYLGWDRESGEHWEYGDMVAGTAPMGWKFPVAIYPRQKTSRMHSQRAWFTIHGDKHRPMESMKRLMGALRKVSLPWEAVGAAREFLRHAGLDQYALFPDLQNLSDHLRAKYKPRHSHLPRKGGDAQAGAAKGRKAGPGKRL